MIIDIHALVGEWPFGEIPYRTADGLLALMDRWSIDQAAVSSLHGLFYKQCDAANRRLAQEIAAHRDRLVPVGVVNPAFPGWERGLRECQEDLGCRAVMLYPWHHGYSPADAACLDALDAAAERGLPVLLTLAFEDYRVHHWATQIPPVDLDALAELLRRRPDAAIVLCSVHTLEVRRLMDAAPESRFLIEISHIEGPVMAVQDLVRDLGAERVLFGTQAPFMNPAGAALAMQEPGFEPEDLELVMAGNAARLLGV